MCFRKAAGVVPLLQGLTKVQIVSHSRFAAKTDFDTSHLGRISYRPRRAGCPPSEPLPRSSPTGVRYLPEGTMPKFPDHARRAEAVCGSPLEVMAPRIAKLRNEGRLFPFQLGDSYLLPPEPARRIDLDLDQETLHRYCPVSGLEEYRGAVAQWVGPQLGIELTEKNIAASVGCTGALQAIATSLFDPGDEILVITPTWPVILGILKTQNLVPVEVPIGNNAWPDDDVDIFRRRLISLCTDRTAGIYFSDPNNPGGFVMPKSYIEAIGELITEKNLWLMIDGVYKDLILGDPSWSSPLLWQNEATRKRVLLDGAFSKSHAMAGHRAGFLVCPDELKRVLTRVLTHQPYHASTSAQAMGIKALEAGPEAIEVVRRSYMDGSREAVEALHARFHNPDAGAFLFLDLREHVDDERGLMELLFACLDVGVALAPGSIFGNDFGCFARLCYTRTPPEVVRDGIVLLNKVLNS